MALLSVPIVAAYWRDALRPLGPEVLLPAAFYLSMYHAPLRRLVLSGEALTRTEVNVLAIASWAAFAVAAAVTIHPGAFRPRALDPARRDQGPDARILAVAGIGITLVGYALFALWVGSIGLGAVLSASYNEIYLLASGHTAVTFQWPFMVGGLVATARGLALWVGKPSVTLWCLYATLLAFFVAITSRLGVRGPTLELAVAIYLVRVDTPKPVNRRTVASFAVGFAVLFFFVSAMRGDLRAGVTGTSAGEVATQARGSVSGEEATEFDAIFDNNVMIAELAGKELPYFGGQTYFDIPVQLVPRQFIDSKPLGLSAWWIEYVDPNAARRGAGRAFGSFAEGYLNFGGTGAVGQVLGVTLFLLLLYPLLRRDGGPAAAAAAVILAHAYHCHRSEAIGVVFFARNAFLVGLATFLVMRGLRAIDSSARKSQPTPAFGRRAT